MTDGESVKSAISWTTRLSQPNQSRFRWWSPVRQKASRIKSTLYCKYARQSARWLKLIRSCLNRTTYRDAEQQNQDYTVLYSIQDLGIYFVMHWLDRCTTCSVVVRRSHRDHRICNSFPITEDLCQVGWQQQLGRLKDKVCKCLQTMPLSFSVSLCHYALISCSSCLPWADSQTVFLINHCEACHEYQKPDIFTRNLGTYTLG